MENTEKLKKSKSTKIINIISNCIFVPVMLFLVVYFVYALSTINRNGVPTFFGQAYARVQSDSMKPSGIKRGDIVILNKVNISSIEIGDVIAFYACALDIPNSNGTPETAKDFKTGQKVYQKRIEFHKVYDIKYDSNGDTWFYTYGTRNKKTSSADINNMDVKYIKDNFVVDNETRGDYVVGVYKPNVLADVIQFISSPVGMISLIIVPSAVLVFTLLLNIIEIVDQMMKEKKQKLVFVDDEVAERELEVTTIIEENRSLDEED